MSVSTTDELQHLRALMSFKNLMQSTNVNIVFLGKITQKTIDGIADMTEGEMQIQNIDKKTSRKVYHVMIEALQNICKHADSTADFASNSLEDGLAKDGIFLIGHNDDSEYFVTTGNQIMIDNAMRLRDVLEQINKLDNDGLKDLYRYKLQNSQLSDVGGAGLGFVDMAKKTGTKYEYYFEQTDDKYCFFVLTVRISAKAGKK
ncbi:MAG: SiaB family protein kinase [Cyclobacteriaceae bacterium]